MVDERERREGQRDLDVGLAEHLLQRVEGEARELAARHARISASGAPRVDTADCATADFATTDLWMRSGRSCIITRSFRCLGAAGVSTPEQRVRTRRGARDASACGVWSAVAHVRLGKVRCQRCGL